MKFLTTVVCAFVLTEFQLHATAAPTKNTTQLDEPPVEDNPAQAALVSSGPNGLQVEGNAPIVNGPNQSNWPLKCGPMSPERDSNRKPATPRSNGLSTRQQATSDSAKRAEQERRKAYEKVAAMLEAAQRDRDEALKIARDRLASAHALASTIWSKASRTWREAKRSAAEQYQQAAAVAAGSVRDAEKESLSVVERAEDEFVREYRQLAETKSKVAGEHREELETALRAREAAYKSAKLGRAKAEAEFARALRQRRLTAEQRAQVKAKLAGEQEKCEDTMESADAEWQRVLDGLGIGEEHERAVDRAFQEFEEGRKKADAILQKAGQEFNQALRAAKRQMQEIEAMANAERAKAEAEARDIAGEIESQRAALMRAPLRKWKKVQNLANQEKQKAEQAYRDTIAGVNTEVTEASLVADEMESGPKSPAGPEDEKPRGNQQKPMIDLDDEELVDDEDFL